MKPICVRCHRFFRCIESGFKFTEGMPAGPHRPPPGLTEPESWKPYKVWAGDRWRCDGCEAVIVCGFARAPIAIQHESDFAEIRTALRADQFQVNDC
jgi:hypothetical protein